MPASEIWDRIGVAGSARISVRLHRETMDINATGKAAFYDGIYSFIEPFLSAIYRHLPPNERSFPAVGWPSGPAYCPL